MRANRFLCTALLLFCALAPGAQEVVEGAEAAPAEAEGALDSAGEAEESADVAVDEAAGASAGSAESGSVTTVTIVSADSTSYKQNEESGDDEITLSGGVVMRVEKDDSRTEINADYVTFNRKTRMLYARGGVEVVTSSGSEDEETITTDTVLVNVSTLEGIFDGGRIVSLSTDGVNLPSDSTLIVASDIFGRDSAGTVAFKNATLTFCDDENPHWQVRASRVWLLPGGEFAFLNAVVYVGHVPVFYLPAFYYPKDELIFNPAFGYHERLGWYVNTTTYLLGRKPLEETDSSGDDSDIAESAMNFMRGTQLKNQVREGLVLHNLDTDYEGDTRNYLKLIADYYTNAGIVAGLAGHYEPQSSPLSDYISLVSGSLQLGFTHTIFEQNGRYSKYPSNEGEPVWDRANFLGLSTPFRYGGDFEFELVKPFSLSLSLPIYSDPYFTEDFESRSEYLNWLSFLPSSWGEARDDYDTAAETSSFEWNANASYTVPLSDALYPYVSDISITALTSNVYFDSKNIDENTLQGLGRPTDWYLFTPERSFFYPAQITPLRVAARIAGNIFRYPRESRRDGYDVPSFPGTLVPPDALTPPGSESSDAPAEGGQDGEETADRGALPSGMEITLPELDAASPRVRDMEGLTYSLDYVIEPEFTSQITYNPEQINSASDFNWSNHIYSTYYQLRSPVTLSSALTYGGDFLSLDNDLIFTPVYQTHPNTAGYTDTSLSSLRRSDYNARRLDLDNDNSFTIRPFIYSEVFSRTSISWTSSIHLIDTKFLGDEGNPRWEYALAGFNDDAFAEHTLNASVVAEEAENFSQSFTFTSNLPPELQEYTFGTSLVFPHVSFSAASGVEQTSAESDDFEWHPFQQALSVSFFGGDLAFTESFNYDLDGQYAESMKLALSWKGLQLGYTMQYATPYNWSDDDNNWTAQTAERFIPYSVTLAYASPARTFHHWFNRISWSPSLTTGIVVDLVRPTNSYFRFVPALTFRIHNAFDLTFSAESQNNVIFRYVQRFTRFGDVMGGETNPFVDLWNSFAFWDRTKRENSGFKLRSLSITVTRNLHDWDLIGEISFRPRVVTDENRRRRYDYNPYITVAISWHPMPSFRTELVDDYGEWRLE